MTVVNAGLVSVVLVIVGLALVVVAVGGSPLPWYAAAGVAAVELLAAGHVIGRNAQQPADITRPAEQTPPAPARRVA